jgi:hypothetical protein
MRVARKKPAAAIENLNGASLMFWVFVLGFASDAT